MGRMRDMQKASRAERKTNIAHNFGDFQNLVYAEAVKGQNFSIPFRFPFRSAKSARGPSRLGVRCVSAATGDGRTKRANIAGFSRYGIVPRMMVSAPERDRSIDLFGKHLPSPSLFARSARRTFRAMWQPRGLQRQPECRSRCPRSRKLRWRTSSSTLGTHECRGRVLQVRRIS